MTISITGSRSAGFKSSHIVGAVGGVLTAVANYGEGSSLGAAAAGAVVGGVVGYSTGEIMGVTDDLGTPARVLNGAFSGLMGSAFSSITTGLVDSMIKATGPAE